MSGRRAIPTRRVVRKAKRSKYSDGQKSRLLKEVTGGFQRLQDFKICNNTAVCFNAATSHVVDGDGVPTGALDFSNWADGKTLQGQVIPAVLPSLAAPDPAAASAWYNGSVLKFEGLQWLGQFNEHPTENTHIAPAKHVSFCRGSRVYMQEVEYSLTLSHNNAVAVNSLAQDGAGLDAVNANHLALAQIAASTRMPLMVRMITLKVRGKDISTSGNLWKDFSLFGAFPENSRKYKRYLDRTFSIAPGQSKKIDLTLPIKEWYSRRTGRVVNQNAQYTDPTAGEVDVANCVTVGVDGLRDFGGQQQESRTPTTLWEMKSAGEYTENMTSPDSYLPSTDRLVTLFFTSESAAGGFALDMGENNFGTTPGRADPLRPHVSMVGYIKTVAYVSLPITSHA